MLGEGLPGKNGRGISLRGFLKAFPDEKACLDFLFWVRGGHEVACRICGHPASWRDKHESRLFRSSCCYTTLSATRGTLFHRSRLSLWHKFYAIMLLLNLSASPSVKFLSGHLDVSDNTALHLLRKIRDQFCVVCAHGSRTLREETVAIQHLRMHKMKSASGGRTTPIHVLAVATATNAFAYVLPRRNFRAAERVLDSLGVRRVVLCDSDPGDILLQMRGYRLEALAPDDRDCRSDRWRAVTNCMRFGLYLQYNVRRWPVSVWRSYLEGYLAEYVLRYNFAHDKAMMFPLLMSSFGGVEYGEDKHPNLRRTRLD